MGFPKKVDFDLPSWGLKRKCGIEVFNIFVSNFSAKLHKMPSKKAKKAPAEI
jgi:hypothetical protein